MNFIQEFFTENSGVLTERLESAGFTTEQAGKFLPEAAAGILKSFQHKELEHIIAAFGMEDPDRLVSAINVNAIAQNVDMNAYQIKSGFKAIMPDLAMAFTQSSGGIVGAAASIAWGSTGYVLNSAKKSI